MTLYYRLINSLSPLYSDPRAGAIPGGCALLATHDQYFDERNNNIDQVQIPSPSSRRGERKKMATITEVS